MQEPFLKRQGNKYNVLIVDDLPQNIQVIGNTLRHYGIAVGYATNGMQAIQIAKTKPLDLILLDIAMPEMDGYQVAAALKEKPETREIPIIFLTAYDQIDNVIKGFRTGAVDYITKPFNHDELLSRISTHLELKHSRDIINSQNKELSQLNKTKDRIFSIIGHDLRGPIGNINTILNSLISDFDFFNKEDLFEMLLDISKSAGLTQNILDNLLFWAKSQRGEIAYNPENIELNVIIDENIELLNGCAKAKNISLITDLEEIIYVYADDNMITTTIRNLITNAIKFSHKNSKIEILVRDAQNIDSSKSMIEIAVKDYGVGICEANLNKIFQSNIHFTTYGTNNEKGTGLGLNLCKEFVQRHGGKITVESEENKGSIFRFTLPKSENQDIDY